MMQQGAVVSPPSTTTPLAPVWQAQAPASSLPPFDPYAPSAAQAAPYSPYAPAPYAPPPYAPAPAPYAPPFAPTAGFPWVPATTFVTVGQYTDLATDIALRRRVFVEMEYIGWWSSGNPVPVLATTFPPGTLLADVVAGGVGEEILFGGSRVDTQLQNGARVNVGIWLNDGQTWAVEEQVFFLSQIGTAFGTESPETPIIARPFNNVTPPPPDVPDALIIAYPGTADGSINITTTTTIQGAGILLRRVLWINNSTRLDLLGGYRFFRLDDSVTISDEASVVGPPPVSSQDEDVFGARNTFNGGDIGLKFQKYINRFSFEAVTKVALGMTSQKVVIDGTSSITTGGVTTSNPSGFFALPSNIGTYRRNQFSLLPEVDLNLRLDVTPNLRAVVGYTLMYLTNVQRSGDAIDSNIDTNQFPPVAGPPPYEGPIFAFTNSSVWLQGINVGLEYRW